MGLNKQEGKLLMIIQCTLTYLNYAKQACCRRSSSTCASRRSQPLLLGAPARKLLSVRHFDEWKSTVSVYIYELKIRLNIGTLGSSIDRCTVVT